MNKTAVITARVDQETLDLVDTLATRTKRSRAWIVAEAIRRYVSDQTAFLDFVQEGLDDLDEGRWISHEDLVRELKDRREKRHAA